jgi:hypothetical protein
MGLAWLGLITTVAMGWVRGLLIALVVSVLGFITTRSILLVLLQLLLNGRVACILRLWINGHRLSIRVLVLVIGQVVPIPGLLITRPLLSITELMHRLYMSILGKGSVVEVGTTVNLWCSVRLICTGELLSVMLLVSIILGMLWSL